MFDLAQHRLQPFRLSFRLKASRLGPQEYKQKQAKPQDDPALESPLRNLGHSFRDHNYVNTVASVDRIVPQVRLGRIARTSDVTILHRSSC